MSADILRKAETNAEAWFSIALRPRKPEGSLGWTAQDGHLDSHTAPELCMYLVFWWGLCTLYSGGVYVPCILVEFMHLVFWWSVCALYSGEVYAPCILVELCALYSGGICLLRNRIR